MLWRLSMIKVDLNEVELNDANFTWANRHEDLEPEIRYHVIHAGLIPVRHWPIISEDFYFPPDTISKKN